MFIIEFSKFQGVVFHEILDLRILKKFIEFFSLGNPANELMQWKDGNGSEQITSCMERKD